MKKKFSFKMGLLIYVAVWLLATLVICVALWNKCKNYQIGYELAEKTADPDLFMAQILTLYNEDNIVRTAGSDVFGSTSGFVSQEEQEEYLKSLVAGKELSFLKSDTSTARKPVYAIFADDSVIGQVTLSMNTESIDYGFHRFSIKSLSVTPAELDLVDVRLTIEGDQKVYVNGVLLTEDNVDEFNKEVGSQTEKKATELTGKYMGETTYVLRGLFSKPEVTVEYEGNVYTLEPETEGEEITYVQPLAISEEAWERMERGAVKGGHLYVANANNMASFGDLVPFLVAGSEAYNNIQSMQAGLTWAGTPEEFEIRSEKMISVKEYGPGMRVCRTTYEVHRIYRGVTYDEQLTYDWLFTYSEGGGWQIIDFCLIQ